MVFFTTTKQRNAQLTFKNANTKQYTSSFLKALEPKKEAIHSKAISSFSLFFPSF